jgi:hypothetical protein
LFTLHLDGFAHALDALGVAASLAGAQQHGRHGAEHREPAGDPQGVWRQGGTDDGDHRSPRRRSSIRAQTM